MSTTEVQEHLIALGWPIEADGSYGNITTQAVADIQRGFAFYDLLVDGHAGPQTHTALRKCIENGFYASEHFKFSEFVSKGNRWIKVNRHLIRALKAYRQRYGATLVVSGYRDPLYNRKVGGAANSQHLYGNATDVKPRASINAVRNLGVFSGIGYQRGSGLVVHVDVRHEGPNTSGGTPQHPTVWVYG